METSEMQCVVPFVLCDDFFSGVESMETPKDGELVFVPAGCPRQVRSLNV